MVHKPKLARKNILCKLNVRSQFQHIHPSRFLLLVPQSGFHQQAFLTLTSLTGISSQVSSASPGVLFGLRLVRLGHPITPCAELWLSLCSVLNSALSEQTPWVDPSPDSSPHLAWDCHPADCQPQSRPCLGPAGLHPVRDSLACAVSIFCSCSSCPGAAASVLMFGTWFV